MASILMCDDFHERKICRSERYSNFGLNNVLEAMSFILWFRAYLCENNFIEDDVIRF